MKVIDLYCGLGGWASGLVNNGFDVTGYDIVDFSGYYPGRFIQADILKPIDFPDADAIVASPPCTEFSKAGMPKTWVANRKKPADVLAGIKLFLRAEEIIQEMKPKYWIIENVRGAQKYVGKSNFHIGSRYFWTNIEPFQVNSEKDEIYGKTKMGPQKDRAAIRSVIPASISRGFFEKITEVKE